MASPLPTPVAAAIGLLPAVAEQVLALPRKAVQFPVYAISGTLTTAAVLRREYVDLAERGERLVNRLLGGAAEVADRLDEAEDRVEDLVERTPFAKAYDKAEDTLEDVVDAAVDVAKATVTRIGGSALDNAAEAAEAASNAVRDAEEAAGYAVDAAADLVTSATGTAADAVSSATGTAADAVTSAADTVAGTVTSAVDDAAELVTDATEAAAGALADTASGAADAATSAAGAAADAVTTEVPEAEQPKGVPTPRASQPDDTRIDTAASASVVEAVEEVVAEVAAETGPAAPLSHDRLPLPDYDHMTLGSLRGRLRSLTVEQLVQVRTYEKAHADRLPVVTMLDNRIAKLASDSSAGPSGPVSAQPAPEQRDRVQGGSKVSPATTNAPPVNPPSQGVPTNPGQPR